MSESRERMHLRYYLLVIAAYCVYICTLHPQSSIAQTKTLPSAKSEIVFESNKGGKPTAGDVFELVVSPPSDVTEIAKPSFASELEKAPVPIGANSGGRVLWWKYDEAERVHRLGITSYKPGFLDLPPIVFQNDSKSVFQTETKRVEYSSIGQSQKDDDLYPPELVALPMWIVVLIALVSCIVLFLIGRFVFVKVMRWRERRSAILSSEPELNPLQRFQKAMVELSKREFLSKAQFKPHYFGVSDSAKRFLAEAYRFDAEEKTTRELQIELSQLGLSSRLVDEWKRVLEEMDVTKFTDQIPQQEQAQTLISRVEELIRESYVGSPAAREESELRKGKNAV